MQIHVSDYQYALFESVAAIGKWTHGPYLGGFTLGHASPAPILTRDPGVRIHSCERIAGCSALTHPNVVFVTPTIRTTDGTVLGDEPLDGADATVRGDEPLDGADAGSGSETADTDASYPATPKAPAAPQPARAAHIEFPYARHSSLPELRDLVARFRPADIHQCAVDAATWVPARALFGDLCAGSAFAHDAALLRQRAAAPAERRGSTEERTLPDTPARRRCSTEERASPDTAPVKRRYSTKERASPPAATPAKRRRVAMAVAVKVEVAPGPGGAMESAGRGRAVRWARGDAVAPPIVDFARLVDGEAGLDVEMAEKAGFAAVEGRWWGLRLECTERRWRYGPEVEL